MESNGSPRGVAFLGSVYLSQGILSEGKCPFPNHQGVIEHVTSVLFVIPNYTILCIKEEGKLKHFYMPERNSLWEPKKRG